MSSIADQEASSSVRTKLNAALGGDFSASGTNTGLPKPGPIGTDTPGAATFTTVAATSLTLTTPLAVAQGGTATTSATGTGAIVKANTPALITPDIGAATGTSLAVSGQFTSTVATGTAPLAVSSTTAVANFNASLLLGGTWAIPGSIGATTPNAGAFTTVSATGKVTTAASGTGGAGLILPHGAAPTSPVNGDVWTTTGGMFARINGTTLGPVSYAIGLLSALGSTTIPSNVDVIQTTGYSTKGLGAGRYVTTASTGGTAYRKQSADARWWTLTEDAPRVEHFGALGDGSTDDLSAFNSAKIISRDIRLRGGGNYKLSGSYDLTDDWGSNMVGAGDNAFPSNPTGYGNAASTITGSFSNSPIIRLYGPVLHKDYFVQYATPQARANTGAIAVEFNTLQAGSSLSNITVYGAQTSFGIKQAGVNNTVFGTKFQNLKSYVASGTHFDMRNYLGGGTHTDIDVLYCNGLGSIDWVTPATACQYGLRLSGCELKVGVVAMDGNTFDANALYVQDSNVRIDSLHIETGKITTNSGAFVETAGNNIHLKIGTLGIYGCRVLAADGVVNASIIKVNGNNVFVEIDELIIDSSCSFTASAVTALNVASTVAGTVKIHKIINDSGHSAAGLWISATENDIVEVFNGKRLFERVQALSTTVETKNYQLYEAYAPGGGSYSTTKTWPAYGTIDVIGPTGVGWPARWYTPGGGVNPADWVPQLYHGGENGTKAVADANYSWVPYKGEQIIDCYSQTVQRDLTLGAGTSPRAIKDGVTVRVINRSGQNRRVYHTDGTTLLRTMATGTFCDFVYSGAFWQQWGSGTVP